MRKQAACALTPEQAGRRGVAWVIGAFVLCPCHLPITLWVAAALLSGTAAGAAILGHPYLAGLVPPDRVAGRHAARVQLDASIAPRRVRELRRRIPLGPSVTITPRVSE